MSHIMKAAAALFLGVAFLAPSVSYAQSAPSPSIQALINALLTRIAELQAELDRISGTDTATVSLEPVSVRAAVSGENSSSPMGVFTIKYDVTPDGSDMYVPRNSGTNRTTGASFSINGGSDFAGSVRSTLTSSANVFEGYYVVKDGDTETFTLTVTLDPTETASLRVGLATVSYFKNQDGSSGQFTISAGSGFETESVTVPNYSAPSTLATYRGYLNGSLFITTQNVSRAYAVDNCQLNAKSNPDSSIRCTWGSEEVYSRAATQAGTPDLTVRNASASASGGTLSASASIANIGSGATPGSFRSVWRVCDSNCTTYDRNGNDLMSALGAGASAVTSFSHAITAPPGLYYYMICADVPYYQVSESDENNNCTSWQAVTVN
jgi:hypothetical protein